MTGELDAEASRLAWEEMNAWTSAAAEHCPGEHVRMSQGGTIGSERVILGPGAARALREAAERGYIRPSRSQLLTKPTITVGDLYRLSRRGYLRLDERLVRRPMYGNQGPATLRETVFGAWPTDLTRVRLAAHETAQEAQEASDGDYRAAWLTGAEGDAR